MKKNLKKIIVTIFVILTSYHQYSYANLIILDYELIKRQGILLSLGLIVVCVLALSVIYLLILKYAIKKNRENEKNIKKENTIKTVIYLSIITLVIIVQIYLTLKYEIPIILLVIIILGIVLSIIVRINKSKKLSNIICVITILLSIISLIYSKSETAVDKYNNKFLEYLQKEIEFYYVTDIKQLITSTINNNREERKTSIMFKDNEYISVDELNELLSKININDKYNANIEYDENYEYIETIIIDDTIRTLKPLLNYEGSNINGSRVRTILSSLRTRIRANEGKDNITLIYNVNDTGTKTIEQPNESDITNLYFEIKNGGVYTVEIEKDTITITKNN